MKMQVQNAQVTHHCHLASSSSQFSASWMDCAVVSSCSSVGSSRSSSWSSASGFVKIAGGVAKVPLQSEELVEMIATATVAATVDLLDCLVIHLVVLAAWDDQADVEDPEEDLTCGVGGLGSGMGWVQRLQDVDFSKRRSSKASISIPPTQIPLPRASLNKLPAQPRKPNLGARGGSHAARTTACGD